MNIDYSILPEPAQESMQAYIETGRPVGGFLTAVLENNLTESFARADFHNRHFMLDYANFLYNEAPSECWGDKEAVRDWITRGGLNGKR